MYFYIFLLTANKVHTHYKSNPNMPVLFLGLFSNNRNTDAKCLFRL